MRALREGHSIQMNGSNYEKCKSFKYLGTLVTTDNKTNEEIKARIAAGNRSYFAQFFLSVPLHAMKALGGRGGIAPTHSRPRH
jgi:hypothetical protein